VKNSSISDHKRDSLDAALEENLKLPWLENREYGEGKTYESIVAEVCLSTK